MDIVIAFDRLSIFIKSLKSLMNKIYPYTTCLVIAVACFASNVPVLLSFYIYSDEEFVEQANNNASMFKYCGRTPFQESPAASYLTFFFIFIRDILTLLLEIIVSVMSLFYYNKYARSTAARLLNPRIDSRGKNLLLMTFYITFFSTISHLTVCVGYVMPLFEYMTHGTGLLIYFYTFTLSCLTLAIKYFSNFFIFFFFNSNFRNVLKSGNSDLN
jgi:hypothetical protein